MDLATTTTSLSLSRPPLTSSYPAPLPACLPAPPVLCTCMQSQRLEAFQRHVKVGVVVAFFGCSDSAADSSRTDNTLAGWVREVGRGRGREIATNGIYMALNCTFTGYEFLRVRLRRGAEVDSRLIRFQCCMC